MTVDDVATAINLIEFCLTQNPRIKSFVNVLSRASQLFPIMKYLILVRHVRDENKRDYFNFYKNNRYTSRTAFIALVWYLLRWRCRPPARESRVRCGHYISRVKIPALRTRERDNPFPGTPSRETTKGGRYTYLPTYEPLSLVRQRRSFS